MENATKALLMAAGILIAIIVLSLAVVMYSRVSEYYQQKQRNITDEQLAAFNDEYLAYNRDDVTGFELVSLINKTIDYNQNKVYGASNTGDSDEQLGDGYKEMSIIVKLSDSRDWVLFNNQQIIEYNGKNNTIGKRQLLTSAIIEMQELERYVNPSDLTKLTAYITDLNSITTYDKLKEFFIEKTKKDYSNAFSKVQATDANKVREKIKKYDDFLAFKRATFRCNGIDGNESIEYKNGQIVKMSFTQN